MTLNEIIAFANTFFDEPSDGKFMRDGGVLARKLYNIGYRELCREAQCAMDFFNSTLTVNLHGPYNLPEDCFVLLRVNIGDAGKTADTKLPRIRMNDIDLTRTGKPEGYALGGNQIYFSPVPNAEYPYSLTYFQGPTGDSEADIAPELIPEAWHYVLAYYIVFQYMKIDKGDAGGGVAKWQAIYENELAKMKDYFKNTISVDYYIGTR